MIVGLFVTLVGTIVTDQDGFARMFSEGTRILAGQRRHPRWMDDERKLRRLYALGLLALLPIGLLLLTGKPLALLQIAGAIEAAHIPLVTALVLYLNRTRLTGDQRPSLATVAANGIAAAFFLVFAALYVRQLLG